MDLILSTFGGEDGGGGFYKLCLMVDALDVRAQAGDDSAGGVVRVVRQFAKLIEIAKANRLTPDDSGV